MLSEYVGYTPRLLDFILNEQPQKNFRYLRSKNVKTYKKNIVLHLEDTPIQICIEENSKIIKSLAFLIS